MFHAYSCLEEAVRLKKYTKAHNRSKNMKLHEDSWCSDPLGMLFDHGESYRKELAYDLKEKIQTSRSKLKFHFVILVKLHRLLGTIGES